MQYSDNEHNELQSYYNCLQTYQAKNKNGHVENSSLELKRPTTTGQWN